MMLFNYSQYRAKALKWFKTLQKDCYKDYDHFQTSSFKPVSAFLISPMTFVLNNFVELNQFPDAWNVPPISSTSNKSYLRLFKDYQSVTNLPVL